MYNSKLFDTIPSKPGKEREKWLQLFKVSQRCCKCGYNHYHGALHFHHINKDKKSKSLGAMKGIPTWKIIEEIYQCIILCANCHAEIHSETF